jgi:YbbR domain-containing protein
MKLKLSKNWIAKILCLLLATGIWFLIKSNLGNPEGNDAENSPPKALPVDERTLQPRK